MIFHPDSLKKLSHSLTNTDHKLFLWVFFDFKPSTLSVISENIQKKFHIYYSIRILACNFNEIELDNGCLFFFVVLQILLEHYFPWYLTAVASMLRIFITSCPHVRFALVKLFEKLLKILGRIILIRFFPLSFVKSLLTAIFQNIIMGLLLRWLIVCKKKSREEESLRRK